MSASSFCSRQKNADEMTAAALCPRPNVFPFSATRLMPSSPLTISRGPIGASPRLLVVRGGAPVEQGLGTERHPGDDEPGLQELPPDDRV